MQRSLLTILISDRVARAVCWTLVHSLWEGVLAAMVAGLVIGCTRRLSAGMRYNLLTANLLLFLVAAGATFSYEFRQGDRLLPASTNQIVVGAAGKRVGGTASAGVNLTQLRQGDFIQLACDFLNTQAATVTLVWMACLILQLLRLTGGLYKLRSLRRNNTTPPGEWWEERLLVLADRLGIKRTVMLLQSGLVQSPAAFGFFKPCILVPLGMVANLPSDQVEAILLHELAHIRRGDYVKNLLLHFTEAIFFFNPGLRWIATLIRREREACCDDMVVAATADRNSYFEALVAFAQFAVNGWATGGSSYAQQLSRGKTDLIWRIRRMMEQENRKLQTMEKTILSFGLMVMVSVCLISMKEKQSRTTKPAGGSHMQMILAKTDTVPQRQGVDSTREKITFNGVSTHSSDHNGVKKIEKEQKGTPRPLAPMGPLTSGKPAPLAPLTPMKPMESAGLAETLTQTEEAPTLSNPLVYTKNPNPTIRLIILDLTANRLIDHVDQLSFTLDSDKLIVNGVKQQDGIYLKYKEKYIQYPKDHFIYSQYYTKHGSGSHCDVDTGP